MKTSASPDLPPLDPHWIAWGQRQSTRENPATPATTAAPAKPHRRRKAVATEPPPPTPIEVPAEVVQEAA